MRIRAALIGVTAVVLLLSPLRANGPLGIYGIVEKIVFEPDEARAERVQIWGAFAYADGGTVIPYRFSKPERGFLYFQMPAGINAERTTLTRREWSDLKSVAGTGQAIGFGRWAYSGEFHRQDPVTQHLLESSPSGSGATDLQVRPASDKPGTPVDYQADMGIVKLSPNGARADIVKELQDTLTK